MASKGSVTWRRRKARLTSKKPRSSAGNVSTALLMTNFCVLSPQAWSNDGKNTQAKKPRAAAPAANRAGSHAEPVRLQNGREGISGLDANRFAQSAALAAIGKVNHKSNDEPDEKANPVFEREAGHEYHASDDRKNRQVRRERNPEAAGGRAASGVAPARRRRRARRRRACRCWKGQPACRYRKFPQGYPPRSLPPRLRRAECGSADGLWKKPAATSRHATWQTKRAPGRIGRRAARRSCP